MCNACGFLCCGSDEFDRCGCESCPNPECWPDDDIDYFDDDYAADYGFCGCNKPSAFQCVETGGGA